MFGSLSLLNERELLLAHDVGAALALTLISSIKQFYSTHRRKSASASTLMFPQLCRKQQGRKGCQKRKDQTEMNALVLEHVRVKSDRAVDKIHCQAQH
jgi:hypothetical protein